MCLATDKRVGTFWQREMCGTSRAAPRLPVRDSVGARTQEKAAAGQEPCWTCPWEGFP